MKNTLHIDFNDFILAVKIADREMNLDNGFKSTTCAHINKKVYNRKKVSNNLAD